MGTKVSVTGIICPSRLPHFKGAVHYVSEFENVRARQMEPFHYIENLLVVDAACFTSHPEQSVTLPIMAWSLRANQHSAEEIRLGNVQEFLRLGGNQGPRANENVDDQRD